MRLSRSLQAWGKPDFNATLKAELERHGTGYLPVMQGAGSHVLEQTPSVMVIGASEDETSISARVGVFFSSILLGCACTDDPTPASETNEYCEVRLTIDKTTGDTDVSLLR